MKLNILMFGKKIKDMTITEQKAYGAAQEKRYKKRHPEQVKKWKISGIKKQIRDRLGNKCIVCGWTEGLHIHHTKEKRNERDYKISELPNYYLLCPNHHYEAHRNIKKGNNPLPKEKDIKLISG